MQHKLLFLTLISSLLFGCTQQEALLVPQPDAQAQSGDSLSYMPLKVGNYWVHEIIRVDTNGTETFERLDSMIVTDSVQLNGHTYFHLYRTKWCQQFVDTLLRDSSDCIVNSVGKILFSANTTDTFNYTLGPPVHYYFGTPGFISLQTQAGSFTCKLYQGVVVNYFVYPYRYLPNYYARGVGKVMDIVWWSPPHNYEKRLLRYHLN